MLLALGSNIEPAAHVPQALALLRGRFEVLYVSARVVGPAYGAATPQPPFENLAVRARTDLPYRALKLACRRIEEVCGRLRSADREAPRTMDIDIVFGDPAFTATAEGAVPAPDLLLRRYLLRPCAEAWPGAVHPATGQTLAQHLERPLA